MKVKWLKVVPMVSVDLSCPFGEIILCLSVDFTAAFIKQTRVLVSTLKMKLSSTKDYTKKMFHITTGIMITN